MWNIWVKSFSSVGVDAEQLKEVNVFVSSLLILDVLFLSVLT